MEDTKPRRIILPQKSPQAEVKEAIRDTSPERIVDDALAAISIEVMRYRSKVSQGRSLDLKEARVLQGYIKSMCELSKELRDRDRAAKLDELSSEELFVLAKKVLHSAEIPEQASEPEVEEDEEE
jgi:hypothetical protein